MDSTPRSLSDIANLKLPPGILSGGLDTIIRVIATLLNLGIAIAFLLAFFFLVFGGIKYIISGGDKKGLEEAKNTINHALIGLVLALCSFAIIAFIQSWFGITLGLPFTPFKPSAPSSISASKAAQEYCTGNTIYIPFEDCYQGVKKAIEKGEKPPYSY